MERIELKADYKQNMQELLSGSFPAFLESMNMPSVRGLRVNTLRLTMAEFAALCDFSIEQSEIAPEGFVITDTETGLGNHPLHISGAMYLQEPSAMSVFSKFESADNLRILDMCAAPGGKTGGIAQRMHGNGLLVSNEIEKSRARELFSNVERLGITNAAVVCLRPDRIAELLPGYFDIVAVDAPCSGEGMIRKNPNAMLEWSIEHVNACALRQYAILESAAKCLAPGGKIVYSTCTFEQKENEQVLERFVHEHDDFVISETERLYPHTCRGEGHFVGILQSTAKKQERSELIVPKKSAYSPCKNKLFDNAMTDIFESVPNTAAYALKDGHVFFAETELVRIAETLKALYFGVGAGVLHERYFEPEHSLFMANHGGSYKRNLDVGEDEKLYRAFLRGEELACDNHENGYTCVTWNKLPIGFGKVTDGVLKNKLPKGLRRNV